MYTVNIVVFCSVFTLVHFQLQVSATDPDCGVNAMVNYTLGDFGKQQEFTVRSGTGEICIASDLDYETRNVYEFPIVATDRGKKNAAYAQWRNWLRPPKILNLV